MRSPTGSGELILGGARGGCPGATGRTVVTNTLFYDVIGGVYDWLGFDIVGDAVFRDLVIARIVEPTSKADAERVLADLGAERCRTGRFRDTSCDQHGKYRDAIAAKCFAYSSDGGGLSLVFTT